jgi:mono/diheme cytochrome c family protein
MKCIASLALALFVAACGGKSSPQPTTTTDHDHSAMTGSASGDGHAHDHATGSAASTPAATEPSAPTEPAKPAEPDPAQLKAELLAAEKVAFEAAKPVFDKHCARCHKQGEKLATAKKRDHFDMTTYPFGGHHPDTIAAEIRKSLGMTGKKPRMPADKKGAVKGDELALIAAWADAFDKAHAGGAHEGAGHKHGDDKGHKH